MNKTYKRVQDSSVYYVRIMKMVFIVFVVAMFLYLILGELLLPSDVVNIDYICEPYSGTFEQVFEDGRRVPMEVPGICDLSEGYRTTIETVLPDNLQENTYLMFYGQRADIEVYLNDELYQTYSTKEQRLWGKSSPSYYLFIKLGEKDKGKHLRITFETTKKYAGVVKPIYYGTMIGLWRQVVKGNTVGTMIAVFMTIVTLMALVISYALRIRFRKIMNLEYMAWGGLFVAFWMLFNSNFRQLIVPNVSVVSDLSYIVVMMIPLPFLLYMDEVQKHVHKKIFFVVEMITVLLNITCLILQMEGIKEFSETFILIAFGVFAMLLVAGATMIMDVFSRHIHVYAMSAMGFAIAGVFGFIQVMAYLILKDLYNGIFAAIGLLVLLGMSGVATIKESMQAEQERRTAIEEGKAKEHFLANMSHEIRTPINAILGMNEMILRECDEPDVLECSQNIKEAGNTLLTLINSILDFSKLTDDKMEIVPAKYSVANVIWDVVHMTENRAQAKNLAFEVNADFRIPEFLYGDDVKLKQIVTNLLTNAIKYTEKGYVRLSIQLEQMDEEVATLYVEVEDSGVGIKEEEMEQLFQSFGRVNMNHNRTIEGTGLGIPIVQQLLMRMGSQLEVSSTYGEGSTFSFYLKQAIIKRAPMGDYNHYKARRQKKQEPQNYIVTKNAHLLVVDDNEMNRKVVKGLLKHSQTVIDTAQSGAQAIELVRKNVYDIIFMDHMMPEMDGIETMEFMKKEKLLPAHTVLIALTANAIKGARENYLQAGFHDYLAKPIDSAGLEHILEQYLPADMVEYRKFEKKSKNESVKEVQLSDTFSAQELQDICEICPQLHILVGMSYCMNSKDFYLDVLNTFFERNMVSKIHAAFEKKQWHEYEIQVHALKSSSLSIGALTISEFARNMEDACKYGQVEFVEQNHENLIQQYKTLLQNIGNIQNYYSKEDEK